MTSSYWFKPRRFWNWFAAYYPVSFFGWIVFIGFLGYVIGTLYTSTHWLYAIIRIGAACIVFDIITRLFGEYPSWWRKWGKK